MSPLPDFFGHISYLGLFGILILTGLGLPIPEDIILIGSGWLVYNDAIVLYPTIAVTLSGVLAGDVLVYVLGRHFGHRIVNHPRLARIFSTSRLAKARQFFDRWGSSTIFVARFMMGIRAGVYLTAGILKMSFGRFFLMDFLASVLSVPLLVCLGFWGGRQIDAVSKDVARIKLLLGIFVVVLAFCIGLFVYLRRRRTLRSRGIS